MPQGYATNFADPADVTRYNDAIQSGKSVNYALSVGDNGVGAPALGNVETPNAYGVAVPQSYLVSQFGNDPAAWRRARAIVNYGGQDVRVPIVDVGPGQKQQRSGVITDLTYPLSQALGTGDKAKVGLRLVDNAGPDPLVNQDWWQGEQSQIATQLGVPQNPSTGLLAGPDLSDAIQSSQIADALNQKYS